MAVLTAVTVTASPLTGAALAVQSGSDDAVSVALIGALGGLAVAIVTGAFALLKERPRPDPSRHLPETADLVAQEMSRVDHLLTELRAARAELTDTRAEADLWQQRAYEAGWRP